VVFRPLPVPLERVYAPYGHIEAHEAKQTHDLLCFQRGQNAMPQGDVNPVML
jgi:hypothetical protein